MEYRSRFGPPPHAVFGCLSFERNSTSLTNDGLNEAAAELFPPSPVGPPLPVPLPPPPPRRPVSMQRHPPGATACASPPSCAEHAVGSAARDSCGCVSSFAATLDPFSGWQEE